MGTGYTRNDTGNNIADGNVINASDLDGEFDAVQAAFNGSTGHSHDGTTGEGPQIDTAGLADDAVTGAKIDSTTTVTAASFVGPLTGAVTGNVTGNVTGDVTGNADTATALETARTIGGVSFDGTANINLAGVNTAGNQDTSGNAATATALETARTIGGVSFDGTANINLAGVNTAGNQDTSGNAATATALATGRTIALTGDVTGTSAAFDGTGNVSITATIADDSHNHVISNVDGLQTALDGKQATITGAATTIDDTDLTVSRALVSDGSGKVAVSAVTSTEVGYLDGVTSAIQTQIDGKQASGSYTVTTNNLSDLSSASTARSNLGLGSLATLSTVNAATITDNSVGAAELNVSGNGTSGQMLISDGDGTFSWADAGGSAPVEYNQSLTSTFRTGTQPGANYDITDTGNASYPVSGTHASTTYNANYSGGHNPGQNGSNMSAQISFDNGSNYTTLGNGSGRNINVSGNTGISVNPGDKTVVLRMVGFTADTDNSNRSRNYNFNATINDVTLISG